VIWIFLQKNNKPRNIGLLFFGESTHETKSSVTASGTYLNEAVEGFSGNHFWIASMSPRHLNSSPLLEMGQATG